MTGLYFNSGSVMGLSAEQLSTLRTRLSEAESALHDLMIGGKPVIVRDQSGESVTFSTANVSRLQTYISHLKAQIAAGCGPVTGGAIRPVFL